MFEYYVILLVNNFDRLSLSKFDRLISLDYQCSLILVQIMVENERMYLKNVLVGVKETKTTYNNDHVKHN